MTLQVVAKQKEVEEEKREREREIKHDVTSNGKRQKWNFRRLSSAPLTVEWKYLNLQWIIGDISLFLHGLFKDYKKKKIGG